MYSKGVLVIMLANFVGSPKFLFSTLKFGEHPYDYLNTLSGKLLVSISFRYFSGDFSYSFILLSFPFV